MRYDVRDDLHAVVALGGVVPSEDGDVMAGAHERARDGAHVGRHRCADGGGRAVADEQHVQGAAAIHAALSH